VGISRDYPLKTRTSKQPIKQIPGYEIIPSHPLKYPRSKQGLCEFKKKSPLSDTTTVDRLLPLPPPTVRRPSPSHVLLRKGPPPPPSPFAAAMSAPYLVSPSMDVERCPNLSGRRSGRELLLCTVSAHHFHPGPSRARCGGIRMLPPNGLSCKKESRRVHRRPCAETWICWLEHLYSPPLKAPKSILGARAQKIPPISAPQTKIPSGGVRLFIRRTQSKPCPRGVERGRRWARDSPCGPLSMTTSPLRRLHSPCLHSPRVPHRVMARQTAAALQRHSEPSCRSTRRRKFHIAASRHFAPLLLCFPACFRL
jgi:hypothetical protein